MVRNRNTVTLVTALILCATVALFGSGVINGPLVIQSGGSQVGAAAIMNFSTGTTVSMAGGVATITASGGTTFPTSAVALGTNGSAQPIAYMDSTWAGTPALTSCGTGSTLDTGSNDVGGLVTLAGSPTGCTITFSAAHTTMHCLVTSPSGLLFLAPLTQAAGATPGYITITNVGLMSGPPLLFSTPATPAGYAGQTYAYRCQP